ncbi:MAG: AAA family ATPase [Planctomycetaceae bacterium]
MPTYPVPVLIWKNPGGFFTGSLVEFTDHAAVAPSKRQVLEQLRSLLEWRYQQEPHKPPPSLRDPELLRYRIPVRPVYKDERTRRFAPIPEPVDMWVWCVLAQERSSQAIASLPALNLRIELTSPSEAQRMVTHLVQREFELCSPQELSRLAAPERAVLETIHLNHREELADRREKIDTPELLRVADPLGQAGVRALYGRAWERDDEVQGLVDPLKSRHGNWLLVGPAGSGKTTVLVGAVRTVERQAANQRLFWQTSAGRVIAGMRYLGQTELRMERLIAELERLEGTLCVANLLEFITSNGDEVTGSLAAFCQPYVERGRLRMVAEVTVEELETCRRLMPGFLDLFQVRMLKPLETAQAERLLQQVALSEAPPQRLRVEPQAVADTIRLFHRFLPYQALPGEAVIFWRGLIAQALRSRDRELTRDRVLRGFLERTGLPEQFLRDELPLSWETIRGQFADRVVGQSTPCDVVADVVVRFKAAMNDPQRPLATLLFCGPTGVGKTELAKTLARGLFGASAENPDPSQAATDRQARLLRLDMSEYSGPWAADRLLFQANGQPSEFIRQIRRQPFTVVLFDEIEKAHPSVYDVLMTVFDEGRLSDRFGRVTWFRSAVLVMTSNLGTVTQGSVGFGGAETGRTGHQAVAVRQHFRPEFFNRIDRVVVFDPLPVAAIREITRKELRRVAQRDGVRRWGLELSWSEELVEHLAQAGLDPLYGARPLQRTIETRVVAPLATWLLRNPPSGPCRVHCDLRDGAVVFAKPTA